MYLLVFQNDFKYLQPQVLHCHDKIYFMFRNFFIDFYHFEEPEFPNCPSDCRFVLLTKSAHNKHHKESTPNE